MVLIKLITGTSLDDCRQAIQAAGANGHHSSGNHTHAVLSSIFSYAVDEIKVLDAHPIKGMAKMFPAPQSRDRVLNDEEMAGFVRALKEDTISVCSAAVKVCLLTLQRRSEVAGLRWDEIDFRQRLWTLPPERTKNGRKHIVPLSPSAIDILESAKRFNGSIFVFATLKDGQETHVNPHSMTRHVTRIVKCFGLDNIRLHDIPRTGATSIAKDDPVRSSHVIGRILNHSSPQDHVTNIYNRYDYLHEAKFLLDSYAERVYERDPGGIIRSVDE